MTSASPNKDPQKTTTGKVVDAGANADQPKARGCAASFWDLIRVFLFIAWITIGFSWLFGSYEMVVSAIESGESFWLILGVTALYLLLIFGISWIFRRLIRAVSNRLNKLKGTLPEKQKSGLQKKPSPKPAAPQVKRPTKITRKPGYTNKIGTVDIIWAANTEAVTKFIMLANSSGISLGTAISSVMGNSGSLDEVNVTDQQISLTPTRKVWCETTPIYLDKIGGGAYVLFERLDDDFCVENDLEYLGMIDTQAYTMALCMANGLDSKKVIA